MKTILVNRSLNESFKRAQLLPVLDSEAMARLQAGGSWSVGKPAGQTTPRSDKETGDNRDLPLLRPAHSTIGQTFIALFGLGALVCLGPAAAVVPDWSANWFALAAWVSRLVG